MFVEPWQIDVGDRLILGVNDTLSPWNPIRSVKVIGVPPGEKDSRTNRDFEIMVESPRNSACPDSFTFPARRLVMIAVRNQESGYGG